MLFNPMSLDVNYLSHETDIPKDAIITSNISEADEDFDTLATDFKRVQNFGSTAINDYKNDIKNINHCLGLIARNTNYSVENIEHAVNSKINNVSDIKNIQNNYRASVNC